MIQTDDIVPTHELKGVCLGGGSPDELRVFPSQGKSQYGCYDRASAHGMGPASKSVFSMHSLSLKRNEVIS